jgi:small GTP-binding protein
MTGPTVPHYKVVILGNSGCGKTALIHRWMFDAFPQPSKPTIGSNHHRRRITLENGNPADLYVWDTAGQEQFQSLMPLYARSSSLAIVSAAINDEASFDSIPKWVDTITTS